MAAELVLVLGAYLWGSFPMLYLLGRLRGFDLRNEDMHMALWHKVGRLEGAVGIAWDLGKGALVVVVAKSLGFSLPVVAAAGVMTVVGQMWPVFLKFDGEKGNSTGVPMTIALAPKPALIAFVVMFTGMVIRTAPRLLDHTQPHKERLKLGGPPSLSLPLAMAIGFGVLPLISWWLGRPREISLAFLALFLLIIVRRLTAGVRADFKATTDKASVLINRLLFDRGFR